MSQKRKRAHRDLCFTFSKNDQIGAAGAEDDEAFLKDCFVDTGDLALLMDLKDPRQIVLGRTGAGKSALLSHVAGVAGRQVIQISPENLALTYVSNSSILSFFESIGVNLDPFFKLLWRHVLTVEVLSRYFADHVEPKRGGLLDWLSSKFLGASREEKELGEAVRYLREWGEKFWVETEFRVREITTKMESELNDVVSAQLGTDVAGLRASLGSGNTLTEEQRGELHDRAQKVVAAAQVQDLNKVIKLLDAILEDRQKAYYLLIDGLDENWVEEKLRYKLIMALLETARVFSRVKNAKAIVALRRDLIERVFRRVRQSGFQEEKYQSLYVPLKWTKASLVQILDRRVESLVREKTGRAGVRHLDLLPKLFDGQTIEDYFVERAGRPRDIIAFFNTCIASAVGKPAVRAGDLARAEGEYSRSRLRALADEWSADYPSLLEFVRLLYRRSSSFKITTVAQEDISNLCLELVTDDQKLLDDVLSQMARQLVDCSIGFREFRNVVIQIFYKIGLVGLKLAAFEGTSWADELGRGVATADMDDEVSVVIHPAYHRALGTRLNNKPTPRKAVLPRAAS